MPHLSCPFLMRYWCENTDGFCRHTGAFQNCMNYYEDEDLQGLGVVGHTGS